MGAEQSRQARVRRAYRSLWHALCDGHGLAFTERRVLARAGRELGVVHPVLLFFRPDLVGAYLQRQGARIGARRAAALRRVARAIFADCARRVLVDDGPVGDDGLPHRFAPDEIEAFGAGEPRAAGRCDLSAAAV